MPIPTLTEAQAKKLAKAIAKAPSYDRDEPARELAGGSQADGFALLWSLQERGLLELGRYPEMWDDLAEHSSAATPTAVVGLLRSIRQEEEDDDSDDDDDDSDDDDDDSDDDDSDDDDDDDDDDSNDDSSNDDPFADLERRYGVGEDDDHFDAWSGFWSSDLDRIVLTQFLRDPSAFDGLDDELVPYAARGLASVRLRAGQEPSEAMSEALGLGYAKMLVHGDGGPSEILAVEDGELVETPFFEDGRLGPHVQALVERLGGERAFRRHVLAAALSANDGSMELQYAAEAFAEVDDERMPYLLSRVDWGNRDNIDRAYELLLRRKDPPEQLMAFAEALGDERYPVAADVCRTCAVLRWTEDGHTVPAAVDGQLSLRATVIAYPPRLGFVGLGRLTEALQALGTERAVALLRARLDGSLAEAVRALPAISAVPEPELLERALEVVAKDLLAAMNAADDGDVPIYAWRLLGDAAVEGLAARLAALPEDAPAPAPAPAKGKGKGKGGKVRAAKGTGVRARIALHRALLAALEGKAERSDGQLDPRWDRGLALDASAGKDEPFSTEVGPSIRRVLRQLGPEARDRVLDGMIERGGPELPRIFAFIDLASPAVRARALERFASEPTVRCDRTWMETASSRLGVGFHEEVRLLLRQQPQARERLAEALGQPLLEAIESGPPSENAEALRKAAAKLASDGPRTTIYVIEAWDGMKADATVVSRVGPTALGVPKERWPTDLDGDPMRHMMTLRLADVPELAARFPGKVALAVFLATDGGHAYEPDSDDAAVLLLDEADLAHGPLSLTGGDADDDDDDDDLEPYISVDTRPLAVVPVEVPLAALESEEALEGASKALRKLRDQIEALPGRVGGPPSWFTDEGHDGRFVLQFDDDFETLPVKGRARLYVFDDTALWQST